MKKGWLIFLFIAPTIIFLLIVGVWPLIYSFYLSLHDWDPIKLIRGQFPFLGFSNYRLSLTDPAFLKSFKVTAYFTISTVILEFVIGFGLALLLNRELKGLTIARAILVLPLMVTPIITGLTWRMIFSSTYGIINQLLKIKHSWLGEPSTALMAAIIANVWRETPFTMIMLLAGLRSLPDEPFEAARIDGASGLQMFRYITLPLLRFPILIVLLMRTIFAFRQFDILYLLTAGGPADTTLVLSLLVYRRSFIYFKMAQGAAIAWLMLGITILICAFFIRALVFSEKV